MINQKLKVLKERLEDTLILYQRGFFETNFFKFFQFIQILVIPAVYYNHFQQFPTTPQYSELNFEFELNVLMKWILCRKSRTQLSN